MSKIQVIIPAAGVGSRIGGVVPKQYLPLAGQAVIQHTLSVFLKSARVDAVHVIISPSDTYFQTLKIAHPKLHVHSCGGETRAATVVNALTVMSATSTAFDWVLVHDAARPCLSAELLDDLINTLIEDKVGGLLAIPLAETLKRSNASNKVQRTEPRDHLWQAQTPQMFRYQVLRQALNHFSQTHTEPPTDEAQAVETYGLSPTLVVGHLSNLKITYPDDLSLAELILNAKKSEGKIKVNKALTRLAGPKKENAK
jgi:2-C-methyl-D-erythritol 4-phosphate cytidylyltransferase